MESGTGTDPLLQWLSNAGSLGILAAAVVAFLRGWIVSGAAHMRVIAERDRAMDLVYKQAEIAERALAASERGSIRRDAEREDERRRDT